ncbi:MAG TPA: 50S ribosomal protein L25 [Acidimicrobiales bacterium]|nr:50S ribosomal protein L25 [Acidimicrobiales bacterium]
MSQITLHASTSRALGSRGARRLRHEGSIPAVVYGEGVTALAVAVDAKAFRTAVSGEQGLNSLITLEAEGQNYLVMAREIQRHPVRGTVSHIDFQVIDPNKPVVTEVPLHLIGDAVEVRHADWEVDQQMFSLEIKSRPDQIPTHFEVDISELAVGSSIRVADLTLPEGVESAIDPTATVVTTHPGRVAKSEVPVEDVVAPVAEPAE